MCNKILGISLDQIDRLTKFNFKYHSIFIVGNGYGRYIDVFGWTEYHALKRAKRFLQENEKINNINDLHLLYFRELNNGKLILGGHVED